MSWIQKIFKAGKHPENDRLSKDESLLVQLETSIENCNSEISKAENEIDQLRNWAIDAIREAFEVPNRFWYEELKMYQEIRALEENKSLDYHVVQKCDEIVKGYLEEIELRKAKIELYKSLIVKYLANKEKMLLIKNRKDSESIAQTKLASLEKHSKRLEQLRTDPENFAAHIEETNHLDMIKDEVNEVYEEFEISEEVRDYLLNLDEQFRTSGTGFNSKMAITEIEQLMKKINQEK